MLPAGSTALDFAFGIHSDIGQKCIGAKVNHKLVPIGYKLHSGDQIEIITSNKQKPTEDWLNLAVTAKAKSRIKNALKEQKRTVAEDGKYTLSRKFENIGAPVISANIDVVMNFYKLPSHLDLYYDIAIKKIDLKELKEFIVNGEKLEPPLPEKPEKQAAAETQEQQRQPAVKKDSELIIFGESSDQVMYSLANCCHPIPGDDVFGFVSVGKGLIIHRTNCPNAARLMANQGHRIVKTKCAKNKEISFLTGLEITGVDDIGILNKITGIISGELSINMSALSIESADGIFKGNIKVFVHDKDELEELVNRIKHIEGIYGVERYDPEEKK
jgi:GTP pyrophosphokinase